MFDSGIFWWLCFSQIKPLEEDRAVAAGGELLAEGFIYGVAGALGKYTHKHKMDEGDSGSVCGVDSVGNVGQSEFSTSFA